MRSGYMVKACVIRCHLYTWMCHMYTCGAGTW